MQQYCVMLFDIEPTGHSDENAILYEGVARIFQMSAHDGLDDRGYAKCWAKQRCKDDDWVVMLWQKQNPGIYF